MPSAAPRPRSPLVRDRDRAADHSSDALGTGPSVKLDGRRTHIVDRALDYVALAEHGFTAARIARKRRRSEGYVSITLRLGRAISGMELAEIAALRSPRITWKLAQRIVREDADVVSIRHQLRAALGGFSTHNVDGRSRRGKAARPNADRSHGVAWGWDAAWFARDPLGFVDAHLRYLTGVHQSVHQRAGRTVALQAADRLSVGQSIRSLQRSIARSAAERGQVSAEAAPDPAATAAERQAFAVLTVLARKLAEARAEIDAVSVPPPKLGGADARGAPPDWSDSLDDLDD
jgi:hypothetical protein